MIGIFLSWLQTITFAQSGNALNVSGRVVSSTDHQGLPGVSISIKGTSVGTVSDASGNYVITAKPNTTLVFSFIGYASQEVVLGTQSVVDVTLAEEAQELAEVSVISTGYQEVDKKLFTGSVVSLKVDEVKLAGATDIGKMLQGKAAGVSVQNVSGTFGAAPKIRVRGATSITGDNKPLWVVDNVVLEDVVNVSAEKLTTGDPNTLIGSSVAGLNSDDILSITVLKDAAATALYGARAKDGVILIKTKKGVQGQPRISYTGNFSTYLKPSYNNYNVLNSSDQMAIYLEMERKGLLNHSDVSRGADGGMFRKMYDLINNGYNAGDGGYSLPNTPEARNDFLNRYARANTDWFGLLFKNSFVQEHSIGISSGTDKSQLYFSTSYYHDNGWSVADDVKRYTINGRGNVQISDKVNVGIIATGAMRDQRAPGTISRQTNPVEGSFSRDFDINPFSYSLNTSRALTYRNPDGSREYFVRNYADFNIMTELENNFIAINQLDLKVQGEVGVQLTKELKFDFVGAYRRVSTTTEHKVMEGSNMAEAYRANGSQVVRNGNRFLYYNPDYPNADPVVVLPEGGFYNRTDDKMLSYYFKNQLNWTRTFLKDHAVNALLGQELRQVDRENAFNNGYGYQFSKGGVPFTDYRIIKQLLEGNFSYFGLTNSYDRYASFYSSVNYSFKGKYVFNGTWRVDGSNRLGQSRTARWLPTWNASIAWNADTEGFFSAMNNLDFLTFRAGYGLTANAGNASNAAVVYRSGITNRPHFDENENQIIIDGLENRDLTWEKQYEANIGVNAGLFGKLTLTLDYYNRKHFDLIDVVKTSGIGGEAYKAVNYADMKSHGIDLSIGFPIYKRNGLDWSASIIFSNNKTEITNLKNQSRILDLVFPDGGAKQGYPVRGLFSVRYKGLDHNTGIPLFVDETGNVSNNVMLQSQNTSYLKYEGSVDPTITGGVTNNVRYKDITLNIFFVYQTGNKIRLNPAFKSRYSDLDAMPREFKDRWAVPGDEQFTNIPSIPDLITLSQLGAVYPYNTYNYSSARVVDGSFVRLRTISVSYNLPVKYFRGTGIQNASLSLTGTNLWLVYADKKLYGQDPEFFASGGVAMPVPKQITATVKLTF
jgi:TonB-linked SusC/RagA family outer membrane protein